MPPENNRVERNICWQSQGWIPVTWPEGVNNGILEEDNLVGVDPLFRDGKSGDWNLLQQSPAYRMGFKAIPMEGIGLIQDEFRQRLVLKGQ